MSSIERERERECELRERCFGDTEPLSERARRVLLVTSLGALSLRTGERAESKRQKEKEKEFMILFQFRIDNSLQYNKIHLQRDRDALAGLADRRRSPLRATLRAEN